MGMNIEAPKTDGARRTNIRLRKVRIFFLLNGLGACKFVTFRLVLGLIATLCPALLTEFAILLYKVGNSILRSS